MKKPNFFMIGAPKCGTSSMAFWLRQHPEVYFSPMKEPHFFNDQDELWETRDLATYNKLYEGVTEVHKAVGEGSTWYLFSPEAVPNIEEYTGGDARYIVCLRNPVDMAHSLHSEMHVNGNEPEPDFEKAWRLQDSRAAGKVSAMSMAPSHLQYRNACALGTLLKRVTDLIPPERIKILLIDDIAKQPQETLQDVLRYLDVSDDISQVDFEAKNSAKKPKYQAVIRLVSAVGALKRALNIRVGLGVINRMRRWNTVTAQRDSLRPEFRAELVAAFAAEVDLLETITGQNLDHWRR